MQILAFNGSPRKTGNTSAIIKAMLKGAKISGCQNHRGPITRHHSQRMYGMPDLPEKAGKMQTTGRSESLSGSDQDL